MVPGTALKNLLHNKSSDGEFTIRGFIIYYFTPEQLAGVL